MATLTDVITEITKEASDKGKVLRSWRFTGKGLGPGFSGSGRGDPLGEAIIASEKLGIGEYNLWVTDAEKQLYSGDGMFVCVRKFNVTEYTEQALNDERLNGVLNDNRALRTRVQELASQNEALVKVLTDTSMQNAKAIATVSEGIGKTLDANVRGMEGLAAGQVQLLGSAREILVATAEDARDHTLKARAAGILTRIFDPVLGDVSSGISEIFKEALPAGIKFLKFFADNLPTPPSAAPGTPQLEEKK